MDRVLERAHDVADPVIERVKDMLTSSDGDGEPDPKENGIAADSYDIRWNPETQRLHNFKDSKKFVARETAEKVLGKEVVRKMMMEPATTPQLETTSREQSDTTVGKVKEIVKKAVDTLNAKDATEDLDTKSENPERTAAIDQAFSALKLAHQISGTRRKLKTLESEVELDQTEIDKYKKQIKESEDQLQDMLINIGENISPEQLDVIIDYTDEEYVDSLELQPNEVSSGMEVEGVEVETTSQAEAAGVMVAGGFDKPQGSGYSSAVFGGQAKKNGEHPALGLPKLDISKLPGGTNGSNGSNGHIDIEAGDAGSISVDGYDSDVSPEAGGVGLEYGPKLEELQGSIEDIDPDVVARGVDTSSVHGPRLEEMKGSIQAIDPEVMAKGVNTGSMYGPMLDDLWFGKGDKEMIGAQLMKEDYPLYFRYAAARNKYITDQANARGAGLPPVEQKSSLKERILNKFHERFGKGGQQAQAEQEDFNLVYQEALNKSLLSYGDMSPEQEYERKKLLESNAGGAFEWDISKMRVDAGSEKKFSLGRKAAIVSGLGLAALAGAATGAWEQLQKGEGHNPKLLVGAAFGAVAGFGAAKLYQPKENESTIDKNTQSAIEKVESKYSVGTTESLEGRTFALEGVEAITKREKRKTRMRYIGAVAIGVGAAAGGHYLMHAAWPFLSQHLNNNSVPKSPTATDTTTDQIAKINPLDSDHSGVVDSMDVTDRNGDGVINYQDIEPAESFDPLDTDHSGAVDGNDIPDRNHDGVITVEDSFDPLDTNHDGVVDNKDIPDRNGDHAITVEDLPDEVDTTVLAGTESQPLEPSAQDIYIEPNSSITNEAQQYALDAHGIDLNDNQLDSMYADLFEQPETNPDGVFDRMFNGVDSFTMPDGRLGLGDTGPAELTYEGRQMIDDWVAANVVVG